MSYILDALRRADAERQRGGVPGLHDQASAPTPSATAPHGRSGLVGLVVAAALLLALGGALAWWFGATTSAPAAPALPSVAQVVPPPAAAAASAVPWVPDSALPAPGSAPRVETPPPAVAKPEGSRTARPGPPPASPRTAPTPAAALVAPGRPASERPAAAGARAAASTPGAAASSPPAASAAVRLPRLADLPDALRRELPPLSLGGSVYADQPAMRLVIVNGQLFHEGDQPAPGLRVQQIGLKSVIFEFRGQRFEVPL